METDYTALCNDLKTETDPAFEPLSSRKLKTMFSVQNCLYLYCFLRPSKLIRECDKNVNL